MGPLEEAELNGHLNRDRKLSEVQFEHGRRTTLKIE